MNKAEYMKELIEKLNGFDEELMQEIVSDYEEHFANGAEKGKSEEEVIAELGSVDELLDELQEFQQETAKSHVKMPVKKQEQEKTVWESTQVAVVEVVQSEKQEASQTVESEQKVNEENTESSEQSRNEKRVDSDSWKHTIHSMGEKISKEMDEAVRQAQKALDKIDLNETIRQAQEALNNIDFDAIKDKIADINVDFSNMKNWKFTSGNFNNEETEDDDIVADVWTDEEDLDDVEEEDWTEEWELQEDEEDDEKEEQDEDERDRCVSVTESVSENTDSSDTSKCKKLVIDGKIADVFLVGTDEPEIKVEYENYGSLKDAMQYPFFSYQKGDTFYAGVKANIAKKIGFFQFSSATPHIELKIKVPKNLLSVEVQTASGDIVTKCIKGKNLQFGTKSGDISLLDVEEDMITVSAMSGDICVKNVNAAKLEVSSKSGDISLNNTIADIASVHSVSGDVVGMELEGKKLQFGVTSGDIGLNQVQCENFGMQSVSGDVAARNVTGETIQTSSVSGGIMIWGSAKKYHLSTTSGEMVVRLDRAAEVVASSISGSCELALPKSEEGYAVHFFSTSGGCDMKNEELCTEIKEQNGPGHRSKEIRIGNGQYSVSLRSVSGSANIKVM